MVFLDCCSLYKAQASVYSVIAVTLAFLKEVAQAAVPLDPINPWKTEATRSLALRNRLSKRGVLGVDDREHCGGNCGKPVLNKLLRFPRMFPRAGHDNKALLPD